MTRLKKDSSEQIPWDRIESVFFQVMELPESDRASAIRRFAEGNRSLAAEVESLVHSAMFASEFLESRDDLCSSLITQVLSAWTSPQSNQGRTSSTSGQSSAVSTVEQELIDTVGSEGLATNDFSRADDHSPHQSFRRLTEPNGDRKVTFSLACQFLKNYRPDLQVIEQVGEGAAGIVVRAHDQRLGRDVAVKLLHADWAARLGKDFLDREAWAASLSSDHVVRVYEVSPSDAEIPFLVLEWIAGPTLRAWLSQYAALTPLEAARLALHVSLGLEAAHQRGFVHGDIKPANVMLEPIGPASDESRRPLPGRLNNARLAIDDDPIELSKYRAKLADFGLARRLSNKEIQSINPQQHKSGGDRPLLVDGWLSEFPNARQFTGTPAYASPEQLLEAVPGSVASDIWSVGATLYHSLVGVPPYSGRPHAIIRQMSAGHVKSLRKLDPRIPKDLESICLKAMSRTPDQRYASAAELADDLQRFLDGLPVLARPISSFKRLARLIQRRPLISTLTLLLALALIIGTVVSNVFRVRAQRNFELALENLNKANEERDRAKAVVELLQGMISAADVNFGDRDVKMIDALTGLESRISSELSGMPDIEADVSRTLGNMYFSIAEYEKSRLHFERAISLRGSESLSEESLTDRVGLANTLRWLYLPDQALNLSTENWKQALRILGENHETTIFAGEVLAGCYQDIGKYSEAESMFRLVQEMATSGLGEQHERTLQVRSGLASLLISSGRFAAAETELKNVKLLREATGEVSARESLIQGSNLALVLAELGKLDEAIDQQRENVSLSADLLGHYHDSTITATLNLAESLRRAGRTDEALAMCRQMLDRCSEALGWSDNGTLGAVESVALMLVRLKEHTAALELIDEATQELQSQLPPDSDWLFRMASCRAAALSGLGRKAEAIPLYQQAISHYEARYGLSHFYSLTLLNNFGVALIEANKPQEAIEVLTRLLAETLDKFDSMRPVALRNLGHALLINGQLDQAEESLKKALELSQHRGELDNLQRCQTLLAECREAREPRHSPQ